MKTVAVIFGGRSTEHDISIVTALSSVIKPLELTKKYRVEAIYIDKQGRWFCGEQLKDISFFSGGKIESFVEKNKSVSVQFDGGMTLVRPGGLTGQKTTKIDAVFPAMHGTYGEDGSLMGLLEMAGIPYVGCDLASSVIAMDKVLAKQVVEAADIPTPNYVVFSKSEFQKNPEEIIKEIEKSLKYPLFVKPAHLGSSIGISRATDHDSLINALEVAVHYDDKALVEEEVGNLIEVTLPVMGNDELTPALLERPLTTSEDFFDFDTKYIRGGKKGGGKKGAAKGAQGYSELPAKLDDKLYKKAEQLGINAYKALGCSGIARVDMLIDSKDETVYFNEVNPLPGSLYAHNWRASGVSSVELVDNLMQFAFEKHQDKQQSTTSFTTNFLKQF
jgi:D-alanine-D-alanine ligase